MILEQFYLGCLAHASYLVADERSRVAVVVDPQRDVEIYLDAARAHGVEIRHVLLTHFHADFVAGHLELRRRTGAQIYLGARAKADYSFLPLRDGDALEFGSLRLSILETPGHTPEGISIVVHDLQHSDRAPHAVLTGDTLFIGDVGRPDLLASIGVTSAELASMLYDSLHERLLRLPDETLIYPAHGAGSMCGKQLSTERVSTLGEQRRYNYALQPMSKAEFVALVTSDQPDAPAYFLHDALLNRRERATLDETLERALRPLSLDAVLRAANGGAQVLDVRTSADFAGGHLVGALHVGLDGNFASWAGSVLDPARSIVIVADGERHAEAALRLGRIGFDRLEGYLDGGMAALAERADLVERTQRITVQALAEQLASSSAPLVIDVRSEAEWRAGHLDGSVNVPLSQWSRRAGELPRDRRLALICRTGFRSSVAASLLARAGRADFADVVGGIEAWNHSRLSALPLGSACGVTNP